MPRYSVTIQWPLHVDCGTGKSFPVHAPSPRLAVAQALAQVEPFPAKQPILINYIEVDAAGHMVRQVPCSICRATTEHTDEGDNFRCTGCRTRVLKTTAAHCHANAR